MLRISKIAELAAAVIKAIQITVGIGIKRIVSMRKKHPQAIPIQTYESQ